MKANEIRIGNIFTVSGFPMYVEAIFKDTVYLNFEGNEGDVWEENIKDLIPIPLTEEILNKAGFESHYHGFIRNERIFIEETLNGWNIGFFGITMREIDYLHDLQNLIFALTGEEIKIELE